MGKSFRMKSGITTGCCTSNCFEKNKLLTYLCEFLNKKNNIRTYLNKINEWHEDVGRDYIDFEWLNKAEKDEFDCSFEFFCKKYKAEAISRCMKLKQKIEAKILKNKYIKISILENKIKLISKLMKLNNIETDILGFYARNKINPALESFIYSLFTRCDFKGNIACKFLPYSESETGILLNNDAKLISYGLLETDYESNLCVSQQCLKLLGQQFSSVQELREILIDKPLKTNLIFKDFSHIQEKDFCAKLIKGAINSHAKGINILFYGEPGTGKTEFTKALCKKIRTNLYAVGEKLGNNRLQRLHTVQNIVAHDRNTCLLIDEADDFMEEKKIYINRVLENNPVPCIWIVNSIRFWDKAYLRRFTYAIDFKKPDLETHTQIWQKTFKQYNLPISRKKAHKLAEEYKLTPAFATNAVRSIKLINGNADDVYKSLQAMEKAYNNGIERKKSLPKKTEKKLLNFNTGLLNTDIDLQKFTEQVKNFKSKQFSLCLYGVSGTGKSAYAEYLSEQLNMPIIKKRCSDILSMWHGETEQNIAAAFKEATDKKALLIFDEADSFLQDRSHSYHSWEVTQVNEMLTQMEKHKFPFICTTNLIDNLDKASLRRFTFKVEYKYMTAEQNTLAFEHFFAMKDVDLSHISSLTPGDFTVVKQKAEIMGLLDNKDEIIKMLELEQKQKAPISRKIGFC